MNSIITQDAFCVRPRQDPQRSIVGSGVVEMNAKCQDLAKHTRWGVRIDHTVLYGPRPPTRRVVALPKRQGSVLMPHHKPVGLGRLVKQRCAEWPRLSTKNFLRYVQQVGRCGIAVFGWRLSPDRVVATRCRVFRIASTLYHKA